MLPIILEITAGLSINLLITRNLTKSIVLAPITGALVLALLTPILSPEAFVAIEAVFVVVIAITLRKSDTKLDKHILTVFLVFLAVALINLWLEPYVSNWMNNDEPFHLERSEEYARRLSLPLDYPPLVHMIGGACYRLGGQWYLWYRAVLAMLMPSEGALIFLIAREMEINPYLAALTYLGANSTLVHLFSIGTYSNALADSLMLLCSYLMMRKGFKLVAVLTVILPASNTICWLFLSFLVIASLLARSRSLLLSVAPALVWIPLLPEMTFQRAFSYYHKAMSSVAPEPVFWAYVQLIPLNIWDYYGVAFALALGALTLRDSWTKEKKYVCLYLLFMMSIILAILVKGKLFPFWRIIMMFSPAVSLLSALVLGKIWTVLKEVNGGAALLVIIVLLIAMILTSSPVKTKSTDQDALPFMDKVCKRYPNINLSAAVSPMFLKAFGCSVKRAGPLHRLMLQGDRYIISRRTPLLELLISKDPCVCVIEETRSAVLIEYTPNYFLKEDIEGIYINKTCAVISKVDYLVAITTDYGALCKIIEKKEIRGKNFIIVKCPDLTIRKLILFKECTVPSEVELSTTGG